MYGHSGLFYYLPKLKFKSTRDSLRYRVILIIDIITTWCDLVGDAPIEYVYTAFNFLTPSGECELVVDKIYEFLETTDEPFNFGAISGHCEGTVTGEFFLNSSVDEAFNFGSISGFCEGNLQTIDLTGGTYSDPSYPTELTGLYQQAIGTGNDCSLVTDPTIEYVYTAFNFTATSGDCELTVTKIYLFLETTDEPFNFGTISGECQGSITNTVFITRTDIDEPFNFGSISGSCEGLIS